MKKRLKCEIFMLSKQVGKNCVTIQHIRNGHNTFGFYNSEVQREEPKEGYTVNEANCLVPYDLYFTSNRKMIISDYCIEDGHVKMFNSKRTDLARRIEATTDSSLDGIPPIGISFLKKFCKEDGKISQVMLDLICNSCYNTGCTCGGIGYNCDCGGEHKCSERDMVIKLRDDRTVICSPVKELWDEKELRQVIYAFCLDAKLISTSDEHIIIQIENFIQKTI